MANNRFNNVSPNVKKSPNQGRRVFDPQYFRWPNPLWMIVIPSAIGLLVVSTLSPESIPSFLGPVGTFSKFIGNSYPGVCVFLCILTVVLHVLEAAYAGKICRDRGMTTSTTIKWVFSTFLFGFPSLILRLLPYKPDSKAH